MKTVFIIAGFDIHETAAGQEYTLLRNSIAAKGYKVIPSNISWRQTTPTQYAKKFVDFYAKNKTDNQNIIIGNSFGAVVGLLVAAEVRPELIILCSMSPFFKEDTSIEWPPKSYKRVFGERRLSDIQSYSADDLAAVISKAGVKCKLLYGEKEHQTSPRVVKRTIAIAQSIYTATLTEVKDAPHSFEAPEYVAGITKEL